MAIITLHTPTRHFDAVTWEAQYYAAQTGTNFEIVDSSGVLREASIGSGFTYGYNGFFSSGTINSIYQFSGAGNLEFTATGLSWNVYDRNNSLSIGSSSDNYYRTMMSGNDTITGSSGDDKIYGSKGNDAINGGAGIDVLSFKGFSTGVNVDLSLGTASNYYGKSSVLNVEDVEGSSYGDVLTGNSLNNSFQGFAGNDMINGGNGFDTASYLEATYAVNVNLATGKVTGGSGSDTLVAIERVIGSRFNDTLTGSAVNESFSGGFGNDTINGGGGIDTVEYSGVGSGVTVNLTSGTASGGAGADTLISIENVSGSIFSDSITGNSSANNIRGGNGNDMLIAGSGSDTLNGDAGDDVLRGGTGNDILYGGTGRDIFRFDAALGTSTTQNIDQIKDFVVADDTIQLENAIFQKFGINTTGAINAAYFKANTTGLAADSNDYIIYETDTGKLFYDSNGNAPGGAVQIALLGTKLALTSADFILV